MSPVNSTRGEKQGVPEKWLLTGDYSVTDKRLGWKKAVEHADEIVTDGNLSRSQHIKIYQRMLFTEHEQDQRIALALLRLFIRMHPDDFDSDINLEDLIKHGNRLCRPHWKNFGREILFPIMKLRSLPAVWIDRIADEQAKPLRLAFVIAMEEMAKRKRIPISRILGILQYFLDEPDQEVRENIVKVMHRLALRDSERLHYFLIEHEKGAGTFRMVLIARTRQALGWKK